MNYGGRTLSALKPQDVLVVLKLHCLGEREWSFSELGKMLGLSIGETHNAVKRALTSGLVIEQQGNIRVASRKLFDFLVHGVPAAFFPVRGAVTRGMPTSAFAPPLAERSLSEGGIPLVWPHPEGKVRGESVAPLYPTVPMAASQDKNLYELLVLVDGLRLGRPKEKKISTELLEKKLIQEEKVV